jgi:hypothetical protein
VRCRSPDREIPDIQVTAAQAADELLNINGVQASFLIFRADGGISYSARSMGQLNVQLIMEKLGGGGHHTMAGAQNRNDQSGRGKVQADGGNRRIFLRKTAGSLFPGPNLLPDNSNLDR